MKSTIKLPEIDPKKGIVIISTDQLGVDVPIKDVTVTFSDGHQRHLEWVKQIMLVVSGILVALGYIQVT